MTSDKVTPDHLRRRAIVYVRQSTVIQVLHNLESQRRQYNLVEYARELGFADVVTIDEDLGKSGSGLFERPGFQRLVAEVCAGQVGAVLSIEASRLARNGRDWHHLIELCGVVGVVVIDPEGIYDPRVPNDRLLLGLKGTMNEFELHLFRQRSFEAMRQKARRIPMQPAGGLLLGAKRKNRARSRSSSPTGDPVRFRAVRGAGECPSSSDGIPKPGNSVACPSS